MNERNKRIKTLENNLKIQLSEIRSKMFSIESEIRKYGNTIKESLNGLDSRQENLINLKLKDIAIIGDFLILKYCLLQKKVQNISINVKCFLSINKESNELFVKILTPVLQSINIKVIFSDKTVAQVVNQTIDWNQVFRQNTTQSNHQLMRPFQSCLTFNIKSIDSLKRFDFSKLNQCKPILEANCELSLVSNSLSIYFTRFTHLLMILKWINITINSDIQLIEDKKYNQLIKKSLKNELTFVANINLKKNNYRNVRKQLFELEMTTDRLISKLM